MKNPIEIKTIFILLVSLFLLSEIATAQKGDSLYQAKVRGLQRAMGTIDTVAYDTTSNKRTRGLQFVLGAVYTPVISRNFYGIFFETEYYFSKKFGTGLWLMGVAHKHVINSFNDSIKMPETNYAEFGSVNEYNLLESGRFRLNLNLIAGVAWAQLQDGAVQVTTGSGNDQSASAYVITTNTYFLLEPGLDGTYKLNGRASRPSLCVLWRLEYHRCFGTSNFASAQDYSNITFTLGISLINFRTFYKN